MTDSTSPVLVDFEGPVAIVTLNRPEKRNAMNALLIRRMIEVLEELRVDERCRVVVLTGAGSAFCAGMDLGEFFDKSERTAASREALIRDACEWRYRTLRHFPKPTIAMVNGGCFGGGFSVVECCDLAIASRDAKFCLSEINFRHIPAGPVSKSMAEILRPRDALLYAMTGRTFDGTTAERIGLINEAVPAEELRAHTMSLATELVAKDAAALRLTKESYRYALEMGWVASLAFAQAKTYELLARQAEGASRDDAVQDFRAGQLKPGA